MMERVNKIKEEKKTRKIGSKYRMKEHFNYFNIEALANCQPI